MTVNFEYFNSISKILLIKYLLIIRIERERGIDLKILIVNTEEQIEVVDF